MAETITPVVHGGKRRPYLVASALHVLGATTAAALLGLALGSLGALLRAPWEATPLVIGAVAALYFLREAFRLPVPLPDRKRQVPEWWRTFYSPSVAAFLYGAGLGVGVLTYLSFGTFVAVAAGAVVSGDPVTGLALCAPFGFGRTAAVLVATWADDPRRIEQLEAVGASSIPRLANAAALAAVLGAASVPLA